MTTERIDIVVREDGSRVVRRNLQDIGGDADRSAVQVDRLNSALSQIKSVLAGLGLGYGANEVIKYIDTWANLEGRLKLVTNSMSQLRAVQSQLFDVAQRTRVAYEGTADLFARITRSTQEMNTSDRERIRVTETINKSLIISGASASSAHAALVQLGQGFASGTLRGDELNSVLEQTPRLAEAIATGMGRTVGELRALGQAGKLTSEQVFKALLNQSQALDEEFSKMPQTIGQSFTLLRNELLRFVGQTGEANGVAGNFAAVLGVVASNLNVLFAILQGYTALKIADFFISGSVAIYKKVAAVIADVSATQAQRAATIAAAESEIAATAATTARAEATLAAIVSARADAVAQLERSRANIASAEAAIAAATAAGAQSFALRTLAVATGELAAAEAARAGSIAAMATLGQQQARVSAQIAAATAAETAATTALTAARAGATGAASLAARAVGFLGGPIGIVTTLLGLGVTAWSLWGSTAKTAEKQAQESLEQTTPEIIAQLDKQIAKYEERNRLMQANPTAAKDASPAAERMGAILAQIDKVSKDSNITDTARQGVLMALGNEYNQLTQRLEKYDAAKKASDVTSNADKLASWFAKNKEYLSKTEQLAQAIKEAKTELGNAFTPEVEKKITDYFAKKDKTGQHNALLAYKASIADLEMQQKLEKEITAGGLRDTEAQYQQGLISQREYIASKTSAKLLENEMNRKFVEAELAATVGMGQEEVAARRKYQGELKVIAQQQKNIVRDNLNEVNGLYAATERANRDRDNNDLANLNTQTAQLERKIALYKQLPAVVTDATIADLEGEKASMLLFGADQERIDMVQQKIDAYKRLRAAQSTTEKQAFDDYKANDLANEWKRAGDTIANALTTAFGKGGQALGKFANSYTTLKGKEVELRKMYDDRVKVADGDAKRIRDAEVEYAQESALARAGAYADMAGAAKSFFSEHTAGYKLLEAAERGFRLLELGLAIGNMTQKLAMTTATTTAQVAGNTAVATSAAVSAGVITGANTAIGQSAAAAGVATQALGDPYTAWVRMAAMAAVMVGLGFAVSGGSGGPTKSASQIAQEQQGTGSVFGDSGAKSDSIARSIEKLQGNSDLTLPLTEAMLSSLRNIESAMNGLSNLVLRTDGITTGSNFDIQTGKIGSTLGGITNLLSSIPLVGGVLGKLAGSLFGSTKQNITDSGIQFGGSVTGLQAGQGYNQYATVETTKSSLFGLIKSTKTSEQSQALSNELSQQFGLIFTNLESTLKAASSGLGKSAEDVEATINSLTVATTKLSLKGLSGDELTKAINAVVSKTMDDIAQAVFPGLDAFRKVGEGYAETVIRVSAGVEQAGQLLDQFGIKAVDFGTVVNKQGDVATEIIRQSIQGVEQAGTGIRNIIDVFTGSASDLASTYATLTDLRSKLNNAGLNGSNVSGSTIQGAGGLDNLKSGITDFLENFYTETERNAMKTKQLNEEFQRMGVAMPATKKEFAELVKRFDDGTDAGAKLVGKLLGLSGAFAEVADAAEQAAKDAIESAKALASQRTDLQIRQLELLGNKSAALALKRQQELAAMDASLQPLQQNIYALEDLANARDALQQAYDRESGTLTDVKNRFSELGKSLRSFLDQLLVGDLSTLSPEDKYTQAKKHFNDVYARAKSGDADAMGELQQASTDFLTASKDYFASSQQYTDDFALVRRALEGTATQAESQAAIAQAQLDALNNMVRGILELNTNTLSVKDALVAYMAALSAVKGGGGGGGATWPGGVPAPTPVGVSPEHPFGNDGFTFWQGTEWDWFRNGPINAARAIGGYTNPGNILVGENGPEIVNFDRPGMVYTAEQSAVMLNGSGSSDNSGLEQALEEMKDAIVRELQAANIQRGAAAGAQIDKLDKLADQIDTNTRALERN